MARRGRVQWINLQAEAMDRVTERQALLETNAEPSPRAVRACDRPLSGALLRIMPRDIGEIRRDLLKMRQLETKLRARTAESPSRPPAKSALASLPSAHVRSQQLFDALPTDPVERATKRQQLISTYVRDEGHPSWSPYNPPSKSHRASCETANMTFGHFDTDMMAFRSESKKFGAGIKQGMTRDHTWELVGARPLHSHEAEGLTYAPPVVTPVLSLSARRRNRRRDVLTNAAGAMTHVDGFTARESGPHPFDLKFP